MLVPLLTSKWQHHTYIQTDVYVLKHRTWSCSRVTMKINSFKSYFSSQQVAERWPLFFICPPLTPGTPREFSQRDPRHMLLPGSGDISKPCLAHQLSLSSPGLNEESLLQHWDHVSKRNQFVGSMHRLGYADTYYVRGCGNRSHRSLDSGLWHGLHQWNFHHRWERRRCPHLSWAREIWFKRTANMLVSHGPFPKEVYWWGQSAGRS